MTRPLSSQEILEQFSRSSTVSERQAYSRWRLNNPSQPPSLLHDHLMERLSEMVGSDTAEVIEELINEMIRDRERFLGTGRIHHD